MPGSFAGEAETRYQECVITVVGVSEHMTLLAKIGEDCVELIRRAPGAAAEANHAFWTALTKIPDTADLNTIAFLEGSTVPQFQELASIVNQQNLQCVLLVHPASVISESLLSKAGWQFAGILPLMALTSFGDVSEDGELDTKPSEHRVAKIRDVLSSAFEIESWKLATFLNEDFVRAAGNYVYSIDQEGEIVSAAIGIRNKNAMGLSFMSTPPNKQKQGFGTRLLASILKHAHDIGVEEIYLGATPAGRRLYDQFGFQLVEEANIFVQGPSSQFPDS